MTREGLAFVDGETGRTGPSLCSMTLGLSFYCLCLSFLTCHIVPSPQGYVRW